jgi:hypothetical protein
MGNFSLGDLKEFLSNIEGLVNSPFDAWDDMNATLAAADAACAKFIETFTDPRTPGRGTLLNPRSSATARQIGRARDIISRARSRALAGKPEQVSIVSDKDQPLIAIASSLGCSYEDLLFDNPTLEPMLVPRGTVIRVPASV